MRIGCFKYLLLLWLFLSFRPHCFAGTKITVEEALFDLSYLSQRIEDRYLVTSKISSRIDSVRKDLSTRPSHSIVSSEYLYDLLLSLVSNTVDGHFLLGKPYGDILNASERSLPYSLSNKCRPIKSDGLEIYTLPTVSHRMSYNQYVFLRSDEVFDYFGMNAILRGCLKKVVSNEFVRRKKSNYLEQLSDEWVFVRFGDLTNDMDKYKYLMDAATRSGKKNMIFDLRDLLGGSVSGIEAFLEKIGLKFTCPYTTVIRSKSDNFEFDENIFNYARYTSLPNYRSRLKSTLLQSHLFSSVFSSNSSNIFGSKLIVLVNQYCASACEGALAMLKSYPRTLVVGRNTRGSALAMEPTIFTLPYSKIKVGVSNHFVPFFKMNTNFMENRGFVPDVWVDDIGQWTSQRALDFVRDYFNSTSH